MQKIFSRFFLFFFVIFTFTALAAEPTTKSSQPTGAEKQRLEKAIATSFQQFNPKIIDVQTFGTDLVVVHLSVKAADHNDAFVIVSPNNKVIDIDNYSLLSNIELQKDPLFKKLAEKASNIGIWPGNHDYPTFERLADGAQQLQFNYRLLNGCHACAVGGVATLGFNFDVKGDFIGVNLVKLSPPPVLNNV